ncbi:amino acid deaminase/aldolase [Allosaccharopolyspora coralli]|uniref:Amino acid deaminase/aldolase n=1 Tax=Allosaccharopolyspora coralli TaxID=2665642 RepID=A0A5Q3QB82_9PSEU|nr:amino acid deaminase/aldolase [Allosaccharopolyspora coralli]QGK71921.1 amino acid deaminase/aldolase [Allosaccharopolyspora coralli]
MSEQPRRSPDAGLDTATRHLDAPFAAVDLAAYRANTADLARRARGTPIRLVTKSVRCRSLITKALESPGYSGLLCYSLEEALWLYRVGVSDDLVVAYPSVDRVALRDLATDRGAAAAITVMVDSTEHLDVIDAAAGPERAEVRVCLEVDASWRPLRGRDVLHVGTRRSPVHTVAQARDTATRIVARRGFRLVGVMAYEGQIAGLADAPAKQPLKAAALRWVQSRSRTEIAERRAAIVRAVREITTVEFVNGGGTGSIESTVAEQAVTEVAAGSGLVGPTLFDDYSRFDPRPAVQFALPVVHRPRPGTATLYGGGYIASGAIGADRQPRPVDPGLRLTRIEGAGEVQTPVVGPGADELRLGDRVWFRHAKGGELAERFLDYHLVDDGRLLDSVPTYRGEGRSFG